MDEPDSHRRARVRSRPKLRPDPGAAIWPCGRRRRETTQPAGGDRAMWRSHDDRNDHEHARALGEKGCLWCAGSGDHRRLGSFLLTLPASRQSSAQQSEASHTPHSATSEMHEEGAGSRERSVPGVVRYSSDPTPRLTLASAGGASRQPHKEPASTVPAGLSSNRPARILQKESTLPLPRRGPAPPLARIATTSGIRAARITGWGTKPKMRSSPTPVASFNPRASSKRT